MDLHCDTITKAEEKGLELKSNSLAIDIDRLLEYECPVQTFAIWHNFSKDISPFEKTKKSIEFYKRELEKNHMYIGHINNYEDYLKNHNSFKISSFLTIEGGEALESKLENLHYFYDAGVRSINLTWNNNNVIASSCYSDKYGLTDFGFEVVKEMSKLGMFVDLSHLSTKGIKDVAEKTDAIIFASHSNVNEVLKHKRNLTNYELNLIKERDGIVGINLYLPFILENKVRPISAEEFELHFCKHIDHLLKVMGEDYIAFGSDFDGGEDFFPQGSGVSNISELFNLVDKKFGSSVSKKMFGENFLRLLKKI